MQRSGIQTLDRSYSLLQLVIRAGYRGQSISQLVEASGLSTPTVYRLVRALKDLGLLRQPLNRGSVYPGPELLGWGELIRDALDNIAHMHLLDMAETLGDSFFLMVPDGFHVLCLDIVDGRHPARSYTRQKGDRIPFGVGQASIAILSFMSEPEQAHILDHNEPAFLRARGINQRRVKEAIANCQHLEITCGVEDSDPPEFTGIAVPVFDKDRRPIAALSCCLRRSRLSDDHYERLVTALLTSARAISQNLFDSLESTR
ncbi:IclR family transcriptional regulator [Marinobacter sp. F3R08]|uniref:IclR family transcriptional regulator n=1 Tax=Marinobacter sp. F3R08 TaxID=2841559 RepID=UPI001C085E41|nr:IclR family transcriptional regulator C-terminal domain-containing protein [Marinobacter sp. F3R08]MBU2953527.1 helix-turn-helix domain-containing protein [Marinobacter sp. F3R08]